MSREKWKLIKQKKGFYIRIYRQVGSILIFSTILNLIFGLSVIYVYLNRPDNRFYATNGVTPPEELTPMNQRNMTSTPLLAEEPENEVETKVIPQ